MQQLLQLVRVLRKYSKNESFDKELFEIEKELEKQIKGNDKQREIFEHWNSKKIIQHRRLTDKIKRAINGALKDYSVDEICAAIDHYATILKSEDYYMEYRWTLKEFLQRGLEKFLDFEIARQNFQRKKERKTRRLTDDDYLKQIKKEVIK